ncbi:MAG: MFS transporter, partial [Planctomycetota bacterium]
LYGAVRPLLLTYATLLNEREKPKAISSIFYYESMGFFVGGLLFGFIYDQNQAWAGSMIFPFSGLCCLIAATMMLRIPAGSAAPYDSKRDKSFARTRLLSQIKNDLTEVYQCKPLLRLCFVALLASIANFCFFGMFFAFYTEGVGGSGFAMSITLSVSTVIGMVSFPLARRFVELWGGLPVIKTAISLWIGNYLLMGITSSPFWVSVLFVLPIYPFFLVSVNYLAAETSRSERRGGGLGALAGVAAFSMGLGTVLGGAVGDRLGLNAVPFVAALISLGAYVVSTFLLNTEKYYGR